MGKHSLTKKNAAGWVSKTILNFPPSLKRPNPAMAGSVGYDKDVIKYAFEAFSFLIESRLTILSLPEFGDLIAKRYDCTDANPDGQELRETVRVLKKYPPEIINTPRDNSLWMQACEKQFTQMIRRNQTK